MCGFGKHGEARGYLASWQVVVPHKEVFASVSTRYLSPPFFPLSSYPWKTSFSIKPCPYVFRFNLFKHSVLAREGVCEGWWRGRKWEGQRKGKAHPWNCHFSFLYCWFSSPFLTAQLWLMVGSGKEIKEKRQNPILLTLRDLCYFSFFLSPSFPFI